MSKNIINKKILYATVLCIAFSSNIANAEIITNDKYVKIINDSSYQNITDKQNFINYGSKYGNDQHNTSGWIIDIEDTDFINNTQVGTNQGEGFIIKGCSTPIVLKNVKILNNKVNLSKNYPLIDIWKGSASEVSDGEAPNHDAIITFINSEVSGNNNHIYVQKDAVANIIAQNSGSTVFSDNGKDGTFKVMSNASRAVVNFNADSTSNITVNDSIVDTDNNSTININKSGLTYTGLQLSGSEYVEHTYDITESGGTYNFNDNIGVGKFNIYNGAKINFGSYEHANGGNPITTYGSLNVKNFTNDENGGVLNFVNNHADANALGNVNLGSDIHVNLDLLLSADNTSATGDTFSANVNSASNGKIIIDSFNLPDDKTFNDITGNFSFQILNNTGSKDNLSIELSSEAQQQMQNDSRKLYTGTFSGDGQKDSLKQVTNFDDVYYNWHREADGDIWGTIGLTSKNSLNDSLGVIVDLEKTPTTRVNDSPLGDTLAFVVQGRTLNTDEILNERSFVAGDATANYQVTTDLGLMGGTKLTIDGKNSYDNNVGINGGGFKGITVSSGQALEINNVGSVTVDESDYSYTINSSITNFSAIDILDGEGTVAYIKAGAQLDVDNSVFTGIDTETKWGGVFRIQANPNDTSVNTIKNSYFINNKAKHAAVMDVEGNVDIENCYFIDNIGTESNNALGVSQANPGTVNIRNSKFVHNINSSTVDKDNAAIYVTGNSQNTVNIENSYIANNYGGVYVFNHTGASVIGSIKNTVFEGNESYDLLTKGAVNEISGSTFNNRVILESTVGTIKKSDENRTTFNGTFEVKGTVGTVSDTDFNDTASFKKSVTDVVNSNFGSTATFGDKVTNIVGSNFKDTVTVNGQITKIEDSTFYKDTTFGYSIGDIIDSTFKGTFTKTGQNQTINSITGSTFESNVNFGSNYVTTIDNSVFEGDVAFNTGINAPNKSITNSTFNGTYLARQGNEIINSDFNKGAVLFGLSNSTNSLKIKDSSFKDGNINNNSLLLEVKGTFDIENTEISGNTGARNNYLLGAWEKDTNQKVLIHNGSKINNNSGSVNYLIQNTGGSAAMTIMDSEIKGNSANTAIITNDKSSVLNLVANNGKQVLFQDNTVPVVENKSVINMNADETGKIIINDTISGTGTININKSGLEHASLLRNTDGTYGTKIDNEITQHGGEYQFNKTITGQNINLYDNAQVKLGSYTNGDVTTYGVLNLAGKTFSNDANGGLIDTINSHFDNQNLGSTVLNSDLNFNFDMNLSTSVTDTITANYSTGNGKIVLSDINLVGTKSWGDLEEADLGTKIKILNSNSDSLQLALSDELETTFENTKISFGTSEISRTDDEILETTNWEYDKYKTTIIENENYGQWELSKTSTENDSLEFKGTEIEKTRYETMGDTLMLVNQDTTNPTKNFNAVNDGDTYNVTANLGTTNGTVNVNGIAGGSAETINLNGKTGFELSTATSMLIFNNVTVGDETKTPATTTVATVSNSNANVELNNTVLNGNIDSTVNYDLTLNGETTINGTVDNANAVLSGDESELKFNTDTFENATLNAQSGTINTKDGEFKDYNISSLTSSADARYKIDMSLSQDSHQTDAFVVGSSSTGTIYITFSSDAIRDDMPDDQSVYIQIIKASGGSGPELNYDGSKILTFAQAVMASDNLIVKEHGLYTKDTTNDSIMLRGAQEVFKAWANLVTDEHKEFTFLDDADYTIADTINLDGNDNAEIINNGTVTNNGQLSEFTLTNNGNFTTDAEKIATTGNTVTNNGTLTFTGGNNANSISETDSSNSKVVFSGTSTNNGIITQDNVEITNSGNVTNNALITAPVLNNGTLTSAADKLDGTITNDGILNLTSGVNNNIIQNTDDSKGTVNLSGVTENNKSITAKEINNSGTAFVNTSGAALTGNIKNTGNMTANADDLNDSDSSIVNDGILTLNGGDNTNAITTTVATSTVNFNNVTSNSANITAKDINNKGTEILSNTGNLQSTTFTNDGKFTNTGSGKITATDIVNNADAVLTSSAQNLDGAVNNLGELNLSGTLENKTIAGTGTTYVDSALKLNSGANIDGTFDGNNGNITISSGSVTNHNIGALKGDGNYTLDIIYSTGGGVSIDTITLANDTTDSATVKITALNEGGNRPDDFTKQILFGANANTKLVLSDEVKEAFYVEPYTEDKEFEKELTTPTIRWNDNYGTERWVETYQKELSVIGSSAGLYDTLKYETKKIDESEHTFDPKSENLALINKYPGDGSDNRTMSFTGIFDDETANGVYTVQSNVGTSSAGTLTLNGVKNGTTNTTVDLNSNGGFVLSNDTDLVLNNIDMEGNSTLIAVSNADASITLNNTNMQGAITGTVEFDMTTTGTNTVKDVTKADVTNTGDLSLSGTNNLVNITGTNGTTEITAGTTTVGSINQKTLTVNSGATLTNNGTNSAVAGGSNAGTINGSGKLSNTGTFENTGSISNDITNSGTFTNGGSGITGNVNNTAGTFNNNAKISGNVNNSATMNSSAENLGGTINNTGTLNLNGTLAKTVSGNGTTKVNETLTLNDGASVIGTVDFNGGTVTVSENSTTTHAIGSIVNNGNLNIDLNLSNQESDKIELAKASSGILTLNNVNILDPTTSEIDKNFSVRILEPAETSSIQLALSSEVQSQFNSNEYVIERIDEIITTDPIQATTDWTQDLYERHITSAETVKGKLELSSDKLGIVVKESSRTGGETTDESLGDTLKVINQDETNSDKKFSTNDANNIFTVKEGLGETKGNVTVEGAVDTSGENVVRSTIDFDESNNYKGFELNNDNTTITLKDVEVKNSSALVSGTASTGTKVVLDNVNIHDNGTGIQTAGDVEIKGNSTIADDINVTGDNSQINIDGTDEVTLSKNLTGNGTSKLNISNGTVNINSEAKISALDTTLNDTNLNVANENSLNGLDATFNGSNNLNIANDNIGTVSLGNVNLNGLLKMQVDADLANAKMDKLTANNATIGSGGRIEVSKINLLSPTTQKRLDLLFTNNKDLANVVKYTGEGQIAYSPIYKYNTSYIRKGDGGGYFRFDTPGENYSNFNPSVMASSVAAIVGGYQNQMQALQDGFYHMNRYMKHSHNYRLSAETQNEYALLETPVYNSVPETSQAMWTLPYSTFERVNLKGGVKVDNIAYGMTYGGDSNMFSMGHGFKGVVSSFIGYNGNHMNYDGISISQNGGFLGATLNAYKGNFFTGLTVSTGASTGDAHTMYGQDNITLLTAGVANKTGYNFEFLDGKVILQPSLFLGYSWVNTFDYTNSAGVRINQDALNAIQIVPGLKVIGNTKNGWQPYAGIDMVWNAFVGRNHVKANDVILPQLSERAYVQYGVGIQKTWADRFTGFLQAMVRNGGRNGIVLSASLRWTFGKDSKKTNNTMVKNKTVIKSINKSKHKI